MLKSLDTIEYVNWVTHLRKHLMAKGLAIFGFHKMLQIKLVYYQSMYLQTNMFSYGKVVV